MAIFRDAIWLRALKRLEDGLYVFEKIVCGLSLATMAIAIALTVLARNLGLPFTDLGELGLVAMVPLTLVGGAMCTCLGAHVTVDLIRNVPLRYLRALAETAVVAATIVFGYFYIRSGFYLVNDLWASGDKLLDLGTPLWILAVFFPVGMALMIFHALMRILAILAGKKAVRHRTDAA